MADPVDELKLAKIRKAFMAREGSIRELAERFGVGEGTIKRYKKKENWDALREGKEAIAHRTTVEIQLPIASASKGQDFNELLTNAIAALSADVAALPGKTRETSAIAMGKMIELHTKLNPPTMQQVAKMLISMPNFDPYEFSQLLKQEIDRQVG